MDYFPVNTHRPVPDDVTPTQLDWDEEDGIHHPTTRERKVSSLALGKIAATDPLIQALRVAADAAPTESRSFEPGVYYKSSQGYCVLNSIRNYLERLGTSVSSPVGG